MTVADASVLVSIFTPADPFHQASRTWLEAHLLAGGTITAPSIILSEIAGAIARPTQNPERGRQAVADFQALPRVTLVDVDRALAEESAELACALLLRGADAVYVALAARLGRPLVTWDDQQRERGGQRVDAWRPDMPSQTLNVSDPTIYDTLAEIIERRLRERHPHRTWHGERSDERRRVAERSGVPVDFSGVTIEGNVGGIPVRQQVGILTVDTFAAIDDSFIDRVARIIEDQLRPPPA